MPTLRDPTYFIGFAIALFIATPQVFAENSNIVSLFNQIKFGQACSEKIYETFENAPKCRGLKNDAVTMIGPARDAAREFVENKVFTEAARIAVARNKCLDQQLKALQKNPKNLREWTGTVIKTWINKRKLSVTKSVCANNFWSTLEKATIKRYGMREAFERKRREFRPLTPVEVKRQTFLDSWKGICLDDKVRDSLEVADELSELALPVAADARLFSAIDKLRSHLRYGPKKDQFSDSDILQSRIDSNGDLVTKDGSPLIVDFAPIENALKDVLSQIIAEREATTEKLEKALSSQNPTELTSDLRDYLYREGTVTPALKAFKLIKDDPMGFETEPSPIASCIFARYEQNAWGEITEIGIHSLAASGAIRGVLQFGRLFTLLKNTRPINMLISKSRLGTSLTLGFIAGSASPTVNQVLRSCIFTTYHTPAAASIARKEMSAEFDNAKESLQSIVPFHPFQFEFSPEETPSCSEAMEKDRLITPADQTNCIQELIMDFAPLKLSLPALIF